MMPLLVLPLLALGQPAESAPDGYAFAHVVLRDTADWSVLAESLCAMNPEAVFVQCTESGCGDLAALPCDAPIVPLACGEGVDLADDWLQAWCEEPSGASAGALHQSRRAHRAARWSILFTETYVPLQSPREDMILHADDPVDVLIAADTPVTDSSADAIRPWGDAKVYASGRPDQSSVRAYGVSPSGVRALGPAVGVSEPDDGSEAEEPDSAE